MITHSIESGTVRGKPARREAGFNYMESSERAISSAG